MSTPVKTRKTMKIPVVVASSSMDSETFARHFTARHADSLAGQETLPDNITFEVEQAYRAFHFRLHKTKTRKELKHEHEEDDNVEAVDHAIYCLLENHNWGWKELAGIPGRHVAVFPDGSMRIATRVKGIVSHHKTIEEATDRLLGIISNGS